MLFLKDAVSVLGSLYLLLPYSLPMFSRSNSTSNKTFSNLNIEPVSLETVLSDYLWKYRPEGEFSDAAKQK